MRSSSATHNNASSSSFARASSAAILRRLPEELRPHALLYDRSRLDKHVQKSAILSLISPRLVMQLLFVVDPTTQRRVGAARAAVDYHVEEREALLDDIEDVNEAREEAVETFKRQREHRDSQRNAQRQQLLMVIGGGGKSSSSSSSAASHGAGSVALANLRLMELEEEYAHYTHLQQDQEEEALFFYEEDMAHLKGQLEEVAVRLEEAKRTLRQTEDDIRAVIALDLAGAIRARREQQERALRIQQRLAEGKGAGAGVDEESHNEGGDEDGDDTKQKKERNAGKDADDGDTTSAEDDDEEANTKKKREAGVTKASNGGASGALASLRKAGNAVIALNSHSGATSSRALQQQNQALAAAMAQQELLERKAASLQSFVENQDNLVVAASHFQNEVFQHRPLLSNAYETVAAFFNNLAALDADCKQLENEEEPAARRRIARMQYDLAQDLFSSTVRRHLLEFQLREKHRREREMAEKVEGNLRSSESAQQHQITMANLKAAAVSDQIAEERKQKALATLEYALANAESFVKRRGPSELDALLVMAKDGPRRALAEAQQRLEAEVVDPYERHTMPLRDDYMDALESKIASIGAALGIVAAKQRQNSHHQQQQQQQQQQGYAYPPPPARHPPPPPPPAWVLTDRLLGFFRWRSHCWASSTAAARARVEQQLMALPLSGGSSSIPIPTSTVSTADRLNLVESYLAVTNRQSNNTQCTLLGRSFIPQIQREVVDPMVKGKTLRGSGGGGGGGARSGTAEVDPTLISASVGAAEGDIKTVFALLFEVPFDVAMRHKESEAMGLLLVNGVGAGNGNGIGGAANVAAWSRPQQQQQQQQVPTDDASLLARLLSSSSATASGISGGDGRTSATQQQYQQQQQLNALRGAVAEEALYRLRESEEDALWFHLGGVGIGGGPSSSSSTSRVSSPSSMFAHLRRAKMHYQYANSSDTAATTMHHSGGGSGGGVRGSPAAAAAAGERAGGLVGVAESSVGAPFTTDPSFYLAAHTTTNDDSSSSSSSSPSPLHIFESFMAAQCDVLIKLMFDRLVRVCGGGGLGAAVGGSRGIGSGGGVEGALSPPIAVTSIQWIGDALAQLFPAAPNHHRSSAAYRDRRASYSSSSIGGGTSSSLTEAFDGNAARRLFSAAYAYENGIGGEGRDSPAAAAASPSRQRYLALKASASTPSRGGGGGGGLTNLAQFTAMVLLCIRQTVEAHRGGGVGGTSDLPATRRNHGSNKENIDDYYCGQGSSSSTKRKANNSNNTVNAPPHHLTSLLYVTYRVLRHAIVPMWCNDYVPWVSRVVRYDINTTEAKKRTKDGDGDAVRSSDLGCPPPEAINMAVVTPHALSLNIGKVVDTILMAPTNCCYSSRPTRGEGGPSPPARSSSRLLFPYPTPHLLRPILTAAARRKVAAATCSGSGGGLSVASPSSSIHDYMALFVSLIDSEVGGGGNGNGADDDCCATAFYADAIRRGGVRNSTSAALTTTGTTAKLSTTTRGHLLNAAKKWAHVLMLAPPMDAGSGGIHDGGLISKDGGGGGQHLCIGMGSEFFSSPSPDDHTITMYRHHHHDGGGGSAPPPLLASIDEAASYVLLLFPRLAAPRHVVVEWLLEGIGSLFVASQQYVDEAPRREEHHHESCRFDEIISAAASTIIPPLAADGSCIAGSSISSRITGRDQQQQQQFIPSSLLHAVVEACVGPSITQLRVADPARDEALRRRASEAARAKHSSYSSVGGGGAAMTRDDDDGDTSAAAFADVTASLLAVELPVSLPVVISCALLWAEDRTKGGANNNNNNNTTAPSAYAFPYSRRDVMAAFCGFDAWA